MKRSIRSIIIFSLSCSIIFSCSNNKPGASNQVEEPIVNANQMLDPCHWSYKVEQNSPGEATLIAVAKIDSGWHLYSLKDFNSGPKPTVFTFDALPDYKLLGSTEEINPHKEYDPFFEMEILYFENEAVFKQKVKVLGKKDFSITGTIDYQACLTQCVTAAEDFSFNVKGSSKGE